MTATDGLALATRGLRKSYGPRVALAGLDLSVPTGVVYGFLGPNGAGKTTTMRLLTGLIHPDAGSIELLGRPFGRRDRHRLFEVGALIESPSFYPYLSGRENLRALAATGRADAGQPGRGAARARRAARPGERQGPELLARNEAAARDRGGAAQRPAPAAPRRAGERPRPGRDRRDARDPPRLAQTGKTVFVSSHILGEVQQLADVIGIIAAGQARPRGSDRAAARRPGRRPGAGRRGRDRGRQPGARWARRRDGAVTREPGDGGWLSIALDPSRAAEVNRALATAGIYASGLETGSDLEKLFLELTAGESVDEPRRHVLRGRRRRRAARRGSGPASGRGGGGAR